MSVKIAIANQKGGAGKTTTAICFAQELIRKKKRVLFIDTDAQCNSSTFYKAQIENTATLIDILCADEPAKNCIQHTEKGDIIPSDPQLSEAETSVKMDERRFSHLKRSCKGIENEYDYIVLDTPPAIGVSLKNVLNYADYVIIPVDESGWSVSGLMDFINAIDLARDNNENLKIAGIVTIKAKERTNKSKRMSQHVDKLAESIGTKHFKTKIRESVACSEALTEYFVPLHEYAPTSTTCEDYAALVKEFLKEVK